MKRQLDLKPTGTDAADPPSRSQLGLSVNSSLVGLRVYTRNSLFITRAEPKNNRGQTGS